MDEKTRDVLYSMLGFVRLWQDDVRAGLLPTKESLAAAQKELIAAMEPEDVEAAEKPEPRDIDEFRAVWACTQAAEARAINRDMGR